MWIFLPGLIIEFIGIFILIFSILTDSFLGMIVSICMLVIAITVHIMKITNAIHTSPRTRVTDKSDTSTQPEPINDSTILYSDSLVTLTGNAITFKNYSLLMKPRTVNFTDIDHVDVLEPSLTTGKYRIWGSGNLTIWFPMDSGRSSRDKIFHAYLKNRWMNVGFTVENSAVVTAILKSRGLIASPVLDD